MDSSAFNGYVDKVVSGLVIALALCIATLVYVIFN